MASVINKGNVLYTLNFPVYFNPTVKFTSRIRIKKKAFIKSSVG